MNPIIIIGTGLAGYTLGRELRKLDKDTPLVFFTTDDGRSYSKPMLSNALAKQKDADSLAMADADKMAADLNATIHTQTQVNSIDLAAQKIVASNGEFEYRQLVLAMGANPIRFPIKGDGADDALSINNLVDYGQFRQVLADRKRIAIMGPGLIGCEFANDLVSAGYEVDVIGPDEAPLGRLLPKEAGEVMQQALTAAGIRFHLQTVVDQINKADGGYVLNLANGETVQADLVLSAIGLKPNVTLAKQAGLKVNNGIVVDRHLQTSDAHVYALGDCMEVEGQVLPFVMPIMHCARALAKTLTGEATRVSYPAMPVVVKTPAHAVVICPPERDANGRWHVDVLDEEKGVDARYYQGEQLLGFALTGEAVAKKQELTRLLPPAMP